MWTLDKWREIVDENYWEIFTLTDEEKKTLDTDEGYSIKYIGPIENGTTVVPVSDVPLLYKTFAGLTELVELPLGLKRGLLYDVVEGCTNFNPSKKSLAEFNKSLCGRYTIEPFKNTGSPYIKEYSKLGKNPIEVIANMFDLSKEEVQTKLSDIQTKIGNHYFSIDNIETWGIRTAITDFICSEHFLNILSLLDMQDTTVTFATGKTLTIQSISKESDMKYESQQVVDRLALCGEMRPARLIHDNCIIYRLTPDFELDILKDEVLINALGVTFDSTYLENPYNAGNDATITLSGVNCIKACSCPLQASGTLTIKGTGTLLIECTESMNPCIGKETHTGMSYGRWCPGSGKPLNEIIIDGVTVTLKSKVPNFALGSYGESYVPKITCINGGELICPETTGIRSMVQSGAEGLCGSTKREAPAVYEIQKFNKEEYLEDYLGLLPEASVAACKTKEDCDALLERLGVKCL